MNETQWLYNIIYNYAKKKRMILFLILNYFIQEIVFNIQNIVKMENMIGI